MAVAYQNMESFSTLPSCEVFWSVYRWSIKILSLRSGHPNFGSSQLIVGDPPPFLFWQSTAPAVIDTLYGCSSFVAYRGSRFCWRHLPTFCRIRLFWSDFLLDPTFFGPTFCRIRLFWSDFLSDPTLLVRLFVGSDFFGPTFCRIRLSIGLPHYRTTAISVGMLLFFDSTGSF